MVEPPDPTHVLVLGALDAPERDGLASCQVAVLTALDHADAVELVLDADHIGGAAVGPLAAIGQSFELREDGRYRGELPAGTDPLLALLDVDQPEDLGALNRLVLFCDGTPFLNYQPADHHVELDDGPTDDAAAEITETLADFPVGLFRTEPLVRWQQQERAYAIHPPSITVDETAFPLSELASVYIDRDRRRIELAWHATEQGFLARLFSMRGPSRPTVVEPTGGFERVARHFESVGETLGVLD